MCQLVNVRYQMDSHSDVFHHCIWVKHIMKLAMLLPSGEIITPVIGIDISSVSQTE